MTAEKPFPWVDTHPFISFDFGFTGRIPAATWTLLGECSSKIEHVSGTPLNRRTAEEFQKVFLAKGVHATTAIEGNTLSEDEVRKRLEGELNLPESQKYLGREVDNVVGAYNYIIQKLEHGVGFALAADDLKTLNAMVLKDLPPQEEVVPGEFREHSVTVSDYLAPPWQYVPQMVNEGCRAFSREDWTRPKGAKFVVPILRAILSHLYLAWINPFGDGNGRTARAVEFDLLIRAGAPYLCAHLLSDHYNRTRTAYYRALSAARRSPIHFIIYAVNGLLDSLHEQIEMIRKQHFEVTWINYVHDVYRSDQSARAHRQREIALALASHRKAVVAEGVAQLTPNLAAMYATLAGRTLQRDIAALRSRELVVVTPEGLKANIDLVTAFLPFAGKAVPAIESQQQVA